MKSTGRGRNLLIAGVKISISLALLYTIARSIDLTTLQENLLRLPWAAAAGCLVFLLLITLLAGVRWLLVMKAMAIPLDREFALSVMFIGSFFSQVLPTSVGGDFVRIWHVWRTGVSQGDAIVSVVLERLNGVIGLVFMVAIGVLLLREQITNSALWASLLATLPLCLIGLVFLSTLDRLPTVFQRFPFDRFQNLAPEVRKTVFAWPLAAQLLGLSVLSHILACFALFVLAHGLGAPLTIWQCLGLLPAVILISLIPLSFAGWGIREGAMVVMLGFAGLSPVLALSLSVLFGVALLVASLPGLVLWLLGWPRQQALV